LPRINQQNDFRVCSDIADAERKNTSPGPVLNFIPKLKFQACLIITSALINIDFKDKSPAKMANYRYIDT
jgi:hypothetical protein